MRRLFIQAVAAATLTTLLSGMGSFPKEEPELKSHLTLYIGEPLLSEGGTVIVASIPLPMDEWQALTGVNLAEDDPDNRKRAVLEEQDRLLGAAINARVNFVEMYYPEGGTFGFDLVPHPSIASPKKINSERILIGSGGWTDWDTNTDHVWPDVSTLFLSGRTAKESDPRAVRAGQSRIMNMTPPKRTYLGVTVHEPTPQQVSDGTFGEVE